MIYYQSKHLSDRLALNLAKWKRWSRAFLPPDPLGGLQSGIARQFNLKEAFKVYLGGYLVSELKFTIPEAIKILTDLSPWLKSHGFYQLHLNHRNGHDSDSRRYIICIYGTTNGRFAYAIREMLEADTTEGTCRDIYSQTLLHTESDPLQSDRCFSAHLLAITTLYKRFIESVEG